MISGPNLRGTLRSKEFTKDVFAVMDRFTPQARDRALYRYSPKNYSGAGGSVFSRSLAETGGYYFSIRSIHSFEEQIFGVLKNHHAGEIAVVITVSGGDLSHLKIIAEVAGIKKLKTACFTPRERRKDLLSCGFDEVSGV